MENVVVQAMACSHRHWGMGSADVVRVWRQCSPRSATWVSWCSAGAGAMVFICASKVGVYLEILETDEASHITHARRKHTSLNKIAAIMALDQHGALLKMVVMISQHRLRSSRRPPPSAFLLLCNAKASNYRENKVFKGLAYYSKWPKVADAVIEATTPLYRKTVLVLAVIVHMLKYAQMGSEKGCRSCKKLALRDNRPINKCLKDVEGSLHHLTSPVGKVGFSAHW